MSRIAIILGAVAAFAASPVLAKAPAKGASSSCDVRGLATNFVDLFYKQKKVREAFETYVSPGYIQHNPAVADGRDAALAFLEPLMRDNPGQSEVQRVLVDGDLFAVHVRARRDASDRGLAIIDIFRVEKCKIAEHWDVLQPVPEKSANPHPMF